jgi:hypothetical protein
MTSTRFASFTMLLAASLAWPTSGVAQNAHEPAPHGAAAHEHAHHGHDALKLHLDNGRSWPTDASLREGMQRIRSALDTAHAGHVGQPRLDVADGRALAVAVDDAIGFVVANCKLPAQADANLHVLLGRMGQASAELKLDPTSPQAAGAIGAALDDYARYFDHPGWRAAGHAH